MGFYTGTANSPAEILAALVSACVDEDWIWSGNVLHKGTCFMELASNSSRVIVTGGTGVSGGVLTGEMQIAGAAFGRICASLGALGPAFAWPATYSIHVLTAPDEVYCLLNHNVSYWSWLAFGQSPVPGLPGTGNWYAGTLGNENSRPATNSLDYSAAGSIGSFLPWSDLGGTPGFTPNTFSGSVHHGLDGGSWSVGGVQRPGNYEPVPATSWADTGSQAYGTRGAVPLLGRQPNLWNGESILLPIQPLIVRQNNKVSLVADIAHARLTRLNVREPGEIIQLGPDQWRIYPWLRRDGNAPAGGAGVTHSGTFGWAIRYDGS